MSQLKAEISRLQENTERLEDPAEYLAGMNQEAIKGVKEKLTGKCEGFAVSLLQRLNTTLEKVKGGHDFLIHHSEDIIKLIQAIEAYADKNPKLNQKLKTMVELAHRIRVYLEQHKSHEKVSSLINLA